MREERAIAIDLAAVTREEDGELLRVLAWGDPVTVVEEDEDRLKVEFQRFVTEDDGSIVSKSEFGFLKRRTAKAHGEREVTAPADEVKVLKVDFVDVQQGDGAVLETPAGKVMILDGGENQLFARYLAARYPGTETSKRKQFDAMLISHGDADHFSGLTEIHKSETNENPKKRLFAHPQRVFHNGLVKRPGEVNGVKVKDEDALGATAKVDGQTIMTELVDDPTEVPDAVMNGPFRGWKRALEDWKEDGPIEFRRLVKGDDDAFDFLADEAVEVEVLAPIPVGDGDVSGLPKIGDSGHTINGNSIVLRLGFKNWRMLFAGDLNTDAEDALVADHADKGNPLNLRGEVFKVPHHGSHEFSEDFLAAVDPVISVVSSGDEPGKEHIHPRATLVSALGHHSRDDVPSVVFITELVAFFAAVGWVQPDADHGLNGKAPGSREKDFFAFRREAYGIVRVRTDGERLLVFTNSGQARLKEAYAFTADAPGEVKSAKVVKV